MNAETFVLEKFPKLLEQLSSDQQPKWGKMSAQHMVEHLGGIFLIAAGKVEVPGLSAEKQKKRYQILKSGNLKFQPNTKGPNLPDEPLPLQFESMRQAKLACLKALDRFRENFEGQEGKKAEHPAFGNLNYEEWMEFHQLHCEHHLRQFQLIEDPR